MSTILFIIGGALVAIGISAFVVGRAQHITATARGRDVETAPFAAAWRLFVIGGAVAMFIALVTTFVVVIPAGHVGVVTNFGRVEERTLPAGLQVVTPIAEEVVLIDAIGEILGKRDEIRSRAKQALGDNLARYHLIVDDIYISNIAFSH